jgi:hypothetical protein
MKIHREKYALAHMAHRQAQNRYRKNDQDAEWINPDNSAKQKGPENWLARDMRCLSLHREHQNQTGVHEKDQHTPVSDAVKIQSPNGGVLKVQQDVEQQHERDGGGSQEVQIWAFAVSVQ